MPERTVEQKPSETALFAALRRELAHKAYGGECLGPDHLAEIFLPSYFRFFLKFKRIRENTREKLDAALPGLTAYMIARTAYFDRLFLKALGDRTPQIVLLGAGYDSRAYRYADRNRGTRIFELDIAPTQERKLDCLRKARVSDPDDVTFVPIDFNRESVQDVLLKAGYKSDLKTLFIWEGVSYYLEMESVELTLALVTQNSDPETSIGFDYTVRVPIEDQDQVYGYSGFTQSMEQHHAGEAMLFSLEEGEIETFLNQRGLVIVEHLDNQAIGEQYLVDSNGSSIGKITGHFRFVWASRRYGAEK